MYNPLKLEGNPKLNLKPQFVTCAKDRELSFLDVFTVYDTASFYEKYETLQSL